MNEVKVKILTPSDRSKKFVQSVIGKLDSSRSQVSLESQQLSSVGMMPDPNYQVIDIATMSIAQAIRVYEDAKNHTGAGSKYVIVSDDQKESLQQRIDREQFAKSLTELGAEVFQSDEAMAMDIQSKYHEIGINVSENQ